MRGGRNLQAIGAIVFLIAVGFVQLAAAEELSRKEYVERAETLCKTALDMTTPKLRAARQNLEDEKLKIAGHDYVRAADITRRWGVLIEKIPRPSEDATVLSSWLTEHKRQTIFLRKVGEELLKGKRVRAQSYLARSVNAGNRANKEVLGFGFNYCLFKIARTV